MLVLRQVLYKKKFFGLNSVCGLAKLSTKDNVNSYFLKSDYNDAEIPNTTIHELVYSKIERFYKYTACECAETGRSYTFEQLRVKARNLSKALRKILKLNKGDVVAILLPNIPEYPIAALGILEAGLVITTINPIYTSEEISRQLLDSTAKAVITLVSLHETVKTATQLAKRQLPIITIKLKTDESLPQAAINFEELINSRIDIPDFQLGNKDDIALLPYSSGTTGLPKGVELSHYNIVANVTQFGHPDVTFMKVATDNFQEIIPAVLPLFHIYGFTVTLISALGFGSKVVTLSKFSPDLYVSVLKKHNTSLIFAAPPLVLFLAAHPDVKPEYLKSVRVVMSGAAPLGALDEERFLEKSGTNVKILQGYGLTETAPVVTNVTVKMREKFNISGSIGKVLPNTIGKVVAVDDLTGTPLGPNQSGELLVKGPQVMRGYRNRPDENKAAFLDGWFRTGDLVHYDENGFLYVTDRLKELIKVKGYQVAPAELEEVIRDHPSIDDAGVIGIPHPIHGEVPRAYVVFKKNKQIEPDNLQEFVAQKVAPFKQIKGGIEIVDAIPKNAAGKILRRQLKLKYQAENS